MHKNMQKINETQKSKTSQISFLAFVWIEIVGRGGSVVKFSTLRPEGHRFKSCSSRHVGTLGKSFTYSFL